MARDIVRRNETLPAAAPSGLPVDQERAIAALLTGESVTGAAGRAGVARQTVHRWLAEDPDFIAAYNQARREIAEAVSQSLRVLSVESVRVLERALTSPKTPATLKVRAALEVLKMTAAPPEGPTDAGDARAEVARRDRKRKSAAMLVGG